MPPEAIKDLRARLAMTQQRFADTLGVAVKTVQAWEGGTARPGADKIARMGYLASDRSTRAVGPVATLREAAVFFDLDARQAGEGPSGIARELRRLADTAERDAQAPS